MESFCGVKQGLFPHCSLIYSTTSRPHTIGLHGSQQSFFGTKRCAHKYKASSTRPELGQHWPQTTVIYQIVLDLQIKHPSEKAHLGRWEEKKKQSQLTRTVDNF